MRSLASAWQATDNGMRRDVIRRHLENARGFSLIELVVVLLLLAILAALATYSARGIVAKDRLARGVEAIEQFDRALRRAARSQRRTVKGVIDRRRGEFVVDGTSEQRRFRLPRRVTMESLRMDTSGRGLAALGDGSTASYAVELRCDRAKVFVVFAGGSGQVLHLTDPSRVQSILGSR